MLKRKSVSRKVVQRKRIAPIIKKRVLKKSVSLALATALTLGSAHYTMRHFYGKTYPKKIPIVKEFVVKGRRMTFIFGKHTQAKDLHILEKELENAKKKGQPFNVFIFEGADIPRNERKRDEAMLNSISSKFGKIYTYTNHPDKKIRDQAKIELKKLYNKTVRELGEFNAKRLELCGKHGLVIKYGEEYTHKELLVMLQAWVKADQAHTARDYQNSIIIRARHLQIRNKGISRHLPVALEEASQKLNSPVRAISYFGATHQGIARTFDRNQFARTKTITQEFSLGADVSPKTRQKIKLISDEVVRIAQLTPGEVMNYKLPKELEAELKKLD